MCPQMKRFSVDRANSLEPRSTFFRWVQNMRILKFYKDPIRQSRWAGHLLHNFYLNRMCYLNIGFGFSINYK
jgi:hypothetical protein